MMDINAFLYKYLPPVGDAPAIICRDGAVLLIRIGEDRACSPRTRADGGPWTSVEMEIIKGAAPDSLGKPLIMANSHDTYGFVAVEAASQIIADCGGMVGLLEDDVQIAYARFHRRAGDRRRGLFPGESIENATVAVRLTDLEAAVEHFEAGHSGEDDDTYQDLRARWNSSRTATGTKPISQDTMRGWQRRLMLLSIEMQAAGYDASDLDDEIVFLIDRVHEEQEDEIIGSLREEEIAYDRDGPH